MLKEKLRQELISLKSYLYPGKGEMYLMENETLNFVFDYNKRQDDVFRFPVSSIYWLLITRDFVRVLGWKYIFLRIYNMVRCDIICRVFTWPCSQV